MNLRNCDIHFVQELINMNMYLLIKTIKLIQKLYACRI